MSDRLGFMTTLPQSLCELREGLRRLLGERLPRLARPQPFGVRECPFELVPGCRIGQVV